MKKQNSQLLLTAALIISLISASLVSVNGQDPDSTRQRERAIKVFIDCDDCDMNYIREEIPYINYVRDVKEAQVYVRETSELAGNGGRKFTYVFTGLQGNTGKADTLEYNSLPDEARDFTRIWRTQMLKMGLMPFVARSPLYSEVLINPTEEVQSEESKDKWNNWVFELETQPMYEGEESRKEFAIRNGISAVKITNEWKFESELEYEYARTKYTLDDSLHIAEKSYSGMELLLVKSLGEHWSAGVFTNVFSSSYDNARLLSRILPAVEYNIFPYSQSTHKQLRILYGLGNSLRFYNDTTIYNKTKESLWMQQLQIAYRVQEKWGSINVSLEGSSFFHDFTKNRLVLSADIGIRIVKGLSLSLSGSAGRINDQLSLVKGEATEAEILLQLQELETSFSVGGRIGLSYTFGSIYNNIVNPRFGNGTYEDY
jgi:hypothetical protein